MRPTKESSMPGSTKIHTVPLPETPARQQPEEAQAANQADRMTELVISWLLRIGVWTSVAVIALGMAMLLVSDGGALLQRHPGGLEGLLNDGLQGEPKGLSSYGGVLTAVRHGQAFGVIMLGLLILLATPVLRVAVSIIAFLIERDRLYALITTGVLALLITGVLLGKAGG
jgi:uncharacterized membrane protein